MKEFIKKLQNKPVHVRKRILYVTTVALTGLVLIFWTYALSDRFSTLSSASVKEDLKPLGLIRDSLVSTYNDVSTNIKGMKDQVQAGVQGAEPAPPASQE